jgi:hypothetical protein
MQMLIITNLSATYDFPIYPIPSLDTRTRQKERKVKTRNGSNVGIADVQPSPI